LTSAIVLVKPWIIRPVFPVELIFEMRRTPPVPQQQ